MESCGVSSNMASAMDKKNMGSSVDAPRASSVDDNRVTLNMSDSGMEIVKLDESTKVGSMQATAKSSISDILTHETVLSYVSVTSATKRGEVLFKTPISPTSFKTANTPSRVSWLAQLYRYWQGNLLFRFVFTKTILQQTKVLAVFVPNATEVDPAPTPDNAYFYSHKVLMNPANETEWTLEVPFISGSPFRTMDEPTGMLYVMLFQNLVNSSASTNDIYFNVFVAGKNLNFHEMVQLPGFAGVSEVPAAQVYGVSSFTGGTPVFTGDVSFSKGFATDSGNVVQTASQNSSGTYPTGVKTGAPVMASPLIGSQSMYNPTIMKTVLGTPTGRASASKMIGVSQWAPNANAGPVAFLQLFLWDDNSMAVAPGTKVTGMRIGTSDDAIKSYGPVIVFPTSYSHSEYNDRIEHLEATIRNLVNHMAKKSLGEPV